MNSSTTQERPTEGQMRYRNGKLVARVESTRMVEDKLYYTIRRFIQTRQEWAKSTATYAWWGS
jgi:hypothetical protein